MWLGHKVSIPWLLNTPPVQVPRTCPHAPSAWYQPLPRPTSPSLYAKWFTLGCLHCSWQQWTPAHCFQFRCLNVSCQNLNWELLWMLVHTLHLCLSDTESDSGGAVLVLSDTHTLPLPQRRVETLFLTVVARIKVGATVPPCLPLLLDSKKNCSGTIKNKNRIPMKVVKLIPWPT